MFLLSCYFTGFSQQVLPSKTDEFTGERIIEINSNAKPKKSMSDHITTAPKFHGFFMSSYIVTDKNNQITYQLVLRASHYMSHYTKGDRLILILEDKTKIALDLEHTTYNHPSIYLKYNLTMHQIQALANSPIYKMRIYSGGPYYDYDINESAKKRIQSMFTLTLPYLTYTEP